MANCEWQMDLPLLTIRYLLFTIYPVPQNAPRVSAGMNVLNFPEGQRPKATDVSPWYGVY